jgi:hypothetical protein
MYRKGFTIPPLPKRRKIVTGSGLNLKLEIQWGSHAGLVQEISVLFRTSEGVFKRY